MPAPPWATPSVTRTEGRTIARQERTRANQTPTSRRAAAGTESAPYTLNPKDTGTERDAPLPPGAGAIPCALQTAHTPCTSTIHPCTYSIHGWEGGVVSATRRLLGGECLSHARKIRGTSGAAQARGKASSGLHDMGKTPREKCSRWEPEFTPYHPNPAPYTQPSPARPQLVSESCLG